MSHARRLAAVIAAAGTAAGLAAAGMAFVPAASASAGHAGTSPLSAGAIKHVMVIELENESIGATFGPGSPATYLNDTLLPEGEFLKSYYATGHVSLDNYISQVSGQAPNLLTSSDCVTSITSLTGVYQDVSPGTLDPDQKKYPGQVDGQGCVFGKNVQTIGNQLDATYPRGVSSDWREYAEDMGNDPPVTAARPTRSAARTVPTRLRRTAPPSTTPTPPRAPTPPAAR